ncbi:hypothetical protein [Caldimonas sp. KR1-144]|uniref:hypothetical protein n=1 Tax=Caldimonas sp. KR1-144 TaxID=3400911 RepID=UPI003C0F3853
MNKLVSLRKTLAVAALGVAGLAATASAHAGNVFWSIGVNLPPVGTVVSNAPVYPAPAVAYPAPAVVYPAPAVVYPPVVYTPPPVVYRPAPVVYQPAPVYYQPGYWRDGRYYHDRDDRRAYRHGWRDGHRAGHRHDD